MPRPRAITVIAWMFITVGIAGLLKDVGPLLLPGGADQLAKLKADGLADLGPAWGSRLAAVMGGVGLFRGHNSARWLLVAWMAFHIGLSVLHSAAALLIHSAIFVPILYLMFRRSSAAYFRPANVVSS